MKATRIPTSDRMARVFASAPAGRAGVTGFVEGALQDLRFESIPGSPLRADHPADMVCLDWGLR